MIDYEEALRRLEKAVPNHRLLWYFRRGNTPANALLLQHELEKLPKEAPPVADDDEIPDDVNDETMRRFRMDQSTLFSERRKLSNQFHDCRTQRDRARVSEEIQVVQGRIERLKQEMKTYLEQGRIPEPDEKYPVPEDTFRLLGLRDSLRASISRKKREIEHIGREMEENKPEAGSKLEKAEAKLKDLKIHLNHVQKAIENRNLQPGRLSEG